MDDIHARHAKERRDLASQITSLKKQASKKTRKSVNQRCADMERDLAERHRKELGEGDDDGDEEVDMAAILLAQMEASEKKESKTSGETSVESKDEIQGETCGETKDETDNTPTGQPKQKRNRQKERLARRQAEIDRIKAEAAAEAENAVDYRGIEAEAMNSLCKRQNLSVFEINPDGHCLFASISDQLETRLGKTETVSQLRQAAADYITSHPDDFIPFLFDETTMSMRDIDDYVKELTTTAMWGSDMEILALANVFQVPVEVHQAGADTLTFGDQFAADAETSLKIAYFKHSYGLGEHYNSLRDIA
ncbi:hypothetical protein DIURU_005179 [Diutina rugosa]|uniref:OTU domain-containing protein n=1 Tax=Diutina rugosa TaxID=5481 RepID=A0A642UIM3_DIURU|nr:uncharacterized protein DIURU_005179 [Diutina rugosa]KAA8897580.1 hypothetical protein DIURU_005179 [Diutina rugosa]